jgi:hypothetical protein
LQLEPVGHASVAQQTPSVQNAPSLQSELATHGLPSSSTGMQVEALQKYPTSQSALAAQVLPQVVPAHA